MLGGSNASRVTEVWQMAESRAMLPDIPEDFFSARGPTPDAANCRRSYKRYFMRSKAVMQCEGQTHAAYLLDLSRCGVGLLSPVQLFPRQRVELWLMDDRRCTVEIARCRRRAAGCYECGCIFVLSRG